MNDFNAKSISYGFNFDAINNIQQKYIKNSSILERINFINPIILPNIQNMPDDTPIVIIKHEFMDANIIIRRENLSITIPFTEDFKELVGPYILTVCEFIESIMDDVNIKFIGCTLSYILKENSAIESLKNNLLKIENDLCDIDVTYTTIIEDYYYVNTKIANTRIYNQPINQKSSGFLNEEHQNALLLNIDVNDRYAFNIGKRSRCELKSEIKRIKQIADNSFNEISRMLTKE